MIQHIAHQSDFNHIAMTMYMTAMTIMVWDAMTSVEF
jgi:hypothetical protein